MVDRCIGAGIALAHFKIHILADAADQGAGFMALAGMTGRLYYPVSLVIALFMPPRARPLMLLMVVCVLVPKGFSPRLLVLRTQKNAPVGRRLPLR